MSEAPIGETVLLYLAGKPHQIAVIHNASSQKNFCEGYEGFVLLADILRAAGREAMQGREPLDGPLLASIVFTLRKPASAPKKRRVYPSVKPDLSKLLRATEDALVTAGVIADDARIVGITELWKAYPGEHLRALPHPGAFIKIWRIEE